MLAKIDDSNILIGVDWSIIPEGDSYSLNLADNDIYISRKCYMNKPAYNQMAGKRLVVFGDSISALKRENAEGVEKSYSDLLEDKNGCQIYNVAIAGSRLSRRTALSLTPTSANQAYAALDVVELVKALITGNYQYQDAANQWLISNGMADVSEQLTTLKTLTTSLVDYIIIAGGTNDAQWVRVGDKEDADPATLYGSINLISQYISRTFPHIKVFALTPIVRYFVNAETASSWGDRYIPKDGNYLTLAEVVSYIADAWKNNHIAVADMYWSLGINEYNFSQYFPATDSTHPNYKGLERMAIAIDNFINSTSEYNVPIIKTANPVFDKLIPSNYRFNHLVERFFKKVRIEGCTEDLRIAIWDIHRGTEDGKWTIKMLEYDEDPSATGGYICTISTTSEQALLKGTISNNRGTIEMLVDWSVFDDSVGVGADNRYSSRFSLECYL